MPEMQLDKIIRLLRLAHVRVCVCVCLCRRSFNKPKVLACALVLLTKTEKNKLASK